MNSTLFKFVILMLVTTVVMACSVNEFTPSTEQTPTAAAIPLPSTEPTMTATGATAIEQATDNTEAFEETAQIVVEPDETALPDVSGKPIDPPVVPAKLAENIAFEEIAGGFQRAVYLTHAGDDRLFVVEQAGRISTIRDGVISPAVFLDITAKVKSDRSEQGLLSVAFHPDYANNGRFFVYYTNLEQAVVIAEYNLLGINYADVNSERIVLTVPQPYSNHNGGQLQFGPEGYLYIGLGDGGSGGDPQGHGQNPGTLLGTILRISVDGAQPYDIPADNPFVSDSAALDEIWAYGLRNPWRFSFDRLTDDLYIADVGQNMWEEVSFESAESQGGVNYGWNPFEGTHCYIDDCSDYTNTPPIIEYDHALGCSITGGYVYRGSDFPSLNGNYFYGDFCTGIVWATVQPSSGEWQVAQVASTDYSISSFGEDMNGELYVLDHNGTVLKIVASE